MLDLAMKTFETAAYISKKIKSTPDIAIVLGSGLGNLADEVIDKRVEIPYEEIPNFPVSTVDGHKGNLISGKIYNKNVIMMQGRFHYYEGYELDEITFPIRVFALLGVSVLILSNAAGGINKKFAPQDFMIIKDHINFAAISPLRGKYEEVFGAMFPDMTNAYSKRLIEMIKEEGNIKEGVYAYMTGPQYETPAEINMLRILGADAVGMSTVPETIVANQMGMEVLGISCITNVAGDASDTNHQSVIESAEKSGKELKRIVMNLIRKL